MVISEDCASSTGLCAKRRLLTGKQQLNTGGTLKVNSLQANRWLMAALAASIFSGLCIGEKPPSKGGKNEMKPHPDNPQAQGPQKTALTQEVSPLLPRSPRIEVKRKNYIDGYIFEKMERDKIPHAGLATDQEFLRRVYLDLTGRIPPSEVVRKFVTDESLEKRDKLIDSLIEPERYAFSDEDPFVDRWTYWFSDLFGSSGGELGTQGRNIFYDYIRMNLRLNVPYNRFVEEMLTATALT